MKILLVKDVKGQGKAGDIINVSDGYARNFLLARKLGVLAEGKALNEAMQKKESEAYQLQKRKDKALADKAQLDTATVHVKVKAGESGKIFGSVTSKEISTALARVEKEGVRPPTSRASQSSTLWAQPSMALRSDWMPLAQISR